ncbi:MAG: hypothetical protein WCP32_14505 [Bacteroidota bacterium]
MKKVLIVSLIIVGLTGGVFTMTSFKSAPNEHSYIIVRTVETQYKGFGKILVSDGVTIIKTIELEKMFLKSAKVTENFLRIANALEEVRSQGYTLISSNSAGGYEYLVTNYIFQK